MDSFLTRAHPVNFVKLRKAKGIKYAVGGFGEIGFLGAVGEMSVSGALIDPTARNRGTRQHRTQINFLKARPGAQIDRNQFVA